MTQLYTIHWQLPHGKQVTSSRLTEAQVRLQIEDNQRHTPDWTYTVEPPLPNLQTLLDAANARIAELEAVCREVVTAFEIEPFISGVYHCISIRHCGAYAQELIMGDDYIKKYQALRHLLDTLPPAE